jgi:hypothetical protein
MFSLLRYYGMVTTCTVNCCSNVDIIASHMQHHQGNPICHIALSLRLLVQSSPQVRRQNVISHYHLRSKVALDLVDRIVDSSDVW